MTLREITFADIPALFEVRTSTDQNHLSREQLAHLGITEASVAERMRGTFCGWLCETDGQVVGFAMGDRATGELWVIAVRPERVCGGIGALLLQRVEEWLRSAGCTDLWLTTDVDPTLRAYSFYRKHGWTDWKIEDGVRYMRKPASTS
jgi:GNAT superfamily N-acetyltransferase